MNFADWEVTEEEMTSPAISIYLEDDKDAPVLIVGFYDHEMDERSPMDKIVNDEVWRLDREYRQKGYTNIHHMGSRLSRRRYNDMIRADDRDIADPFWKVHNDLYQEYRKSRKQITAFRNEYEFLSNFYPCKVTIDGITYDNAESAFQAQKCEDKDVQKLFVGLTGKEAKKLGRKVKLRDAWDDIRIPAMQFVVQQKFRENKDLRQKLLDTKDLELIEGNTWNDQFWGVCNGKGKNMLGKILMETRAYFNNGISKIIEALSEEYAFDEPEEF